MFLVRGGLESLLLRRICLLGTQNKKLPFSGAFSTKMAEEEGFEPS